MLQIREASARGHTRLDWLESWHSFSFAEYFDPQQAGFSDLRVLNDDRVAPAQGFAMHAHRDMEIVSYVLEGALAHKDSLGNGSVIYPGDVQLMSAGSGIRHSEYNHDTGQAVHFLQLWIVPTQVHLLPGYQQTRFAEHEKQGQLCLLVSPDGQAGSLQIHQDCYIYAGLFEGAEQASLPLAADRCAYVQLARGQARVNGLELQAGDGLKISHESVLLIERGIEAEVLVLVLRAPAG